MRWKNIPLILTVTIAAWLFLRPEWHAWLPAWPGYGTKAFIRFSTPRIALTHVNVIDGTGALPIPDATIVLSNGKILAVGSSAMTPLPAGIQVLDMSGHTAIPGLVGMHDHMFYGAPSTWGYGQHEMGFSFPRLYLASGVTTVRTAGAIEPSVDLQLKRQIDKNWIAGPKMFVTGPYINRNATPEQITKLVDAWANQGATSFKAYVGITREQLRAALQAAHARHLTVAGHLCAVGFREAAALGIDSLEHGLVEDSEFTPAKMPDVCPSQESMNNALAQVDVDGIEVRETIRDLVQHHVAVTSTLPVFETFTPFRGPSQGRILETLQRSFRSDYLDMRKELNGGGSRSLWPILLRKEMQFERRFVEAGGMLLAGVDPTGNGGNLAGFGDQREVELLVEAGFTPVEAIHIATANGAAFLGQSEHIGSLVPGRQADLVLIQGDPATKISDIENVETVFKDGVGYDSAKLLQSVRGLVGSH